MKAPTIDHMFHMEFEKPAAEIKEKATAKIAAIKAKIIERQARLAKLREEYKIDDRALIELLTQARAAEKANEARHSYSYSSSNAPGAPSKGPDEPITIGAGVVNNLLTESDFIEAEKGHIKRLEMMARNVRDMPDPNITSLAIGQERPMRGISLDYAEIEFLGF